MPGRRGYAVSGGWATSGGVSGLPSTLSLNGRSGNQPSQYKATDRIDFETGFASADGDAFEAYLTNDVSNGSGNSSLNDGDLTGGYRYGFNGKENDGETSGDGNQYDYGFRIYNPRLGRFLSTDPLTKKYPELTPYQFASNRPIDGIDVDGLEFLSFHKSMYRVQFNTSTMNSVTTTYTVLQTVYENIPTALQDAKTQSFRFVNGGPVTMKGRDYNSSLDGAIVIDPNKYYGRQTPKFNGTPLDAEPELSDASKPVGKYYGDEVMNAPSIPTKIGSAAAAIKEAYDIGENVYNTKIWNALYDESNLRRGFYSATNTVDAYMAVNPKNGKNYFGDQLKGEAQRGMLINFLTDGYLGTTNTDKLTGSQYSKARREAYGNQLLVAWHGLQIMQAKGIDIKDKTREAVSGLLKKYKAEGGGNQYDNINQYTTNSKQ